jgi:beta-phosphoglucomutase family hydrolase
MLKAVIFDFDGVITDSEVVHMRTFNRLLAQFDFKIEPEDYYSNYLGLSDRDLLKTLIEQDKIPASVEDIPDLIRQKNKMFEQIMNNEGQLFDGVREFLDKLKQTDIRIAICSGALLSEIKLILDKTGLEDYFEQVVSAEQVERGKPYPDGFELALKRINKDKQGKIEPSECIVIEDSGWGIDAANAAGMHTVAVTNSFKKEDLAAAELIITSLEELEIDDLNKLCRRN